MKYMLHVISLGAGVQSSTMALMFAHGELTPMPDYAIFADTGAEPQSVYDWLDHLETLLPFPVLRVEKGNLETDTLELHTSKKTGNRYIRALVPAYYETVNGKALFGRKCTAEYKVYALKRKQRQLAGIFGKQCKEPVVTTYLGISWDEVHRMKESTDAWNIIKWPLVDKRITRQQCLDWMVSNGYPEPPRSACYFCPFHSDKEWMRLKIEEPTEWANAVRFDKELRNLAAQQTGTAKTHGDVFLHQSLKPLDEVSLEDADLQLDMFGDECEGMCGV